jgi:polar amino acid transport system substrate-binding protein
MNHSRVRLTLVAAAFAVLATGCASTTAPVNLATVGAVSAPVPGGVLTGRAAVPPAASTAPQCGDPTASLRPPAPQPAPGHMPARSTMAKIQARGYLIAGVDQNTYLFGYRDPKFNTLDGFDIQMVKDVAQAIFGDTNPDHVQFRAITSAQRIDVLKKGQVDLVARTFTISCARLQDVAFSTVYYQAHRKLLVRADSTATGIGDLGGRRVCATAGSDSLSASQGQAKPQIPVAVNDWSDCLVMLQQGQVDGVVSDDTILAGMEAQDPNTRIVGDTIAQEPYGLAFPQQNTDFVSFANGVLQKIRTSGEWTKTYNHWVGNRLGATPAPPAATYSN